MISATQTRHPTNHACGLCHGEQFELLSQSDRRGKPLDSVICVDCGLVQHATLPGTEELNEYYNHDYRREYNGEYTPSTYRVGREWLRAEKLFNDLRAYLRPCDRVFEIGSGIGCNIKQFELHGYDASSIEPGEGFVRYSENHLGVSVRQAFLSQVTSERKYDFVLLVHVLEHLRDPRDVFRHVRSLMAGGGRFYVEVPNFGVPHAAPGKLFHFAHLYNHTYRTLAMLGACTGFRVLGMVYRPPDTNLGIVFEADKVRPLEIDPDSYQHSIDAYQRFNTLTYHARPRYVAQRLGRLLRDARDRCCAKSRLRLIRELCKQPAVGGSVVVHPAACPLIQPRSSVA